MTREAHRTRILVVEHHEKPSVGIVGDTLYEMGVETPTVWCGSGDPVPESQMTYDGIIVLGGMMSAVDDDTYPYLPHLTRLIGDFAEADKPVLGICLGSQLIARAFGAEAHIGGPLEFGFHPVRPTVTAESDPVMRHLTRPQPLFQWHTDHYTLPQGAERLATGEMYENQAYRIGRATYGMQFHFEVTGKQVMRWIADTPNLASEKPDCRKWLPEQFAHYEISSLTFCRKVVRNWVALA